MQTEDTLFTRPYDIAGPNHGLQSHGDGRQITMFSKDGKTRVALSAWPSLVRPKSNYRPAGWGEWTESPNPSFPTIRFSGLYLSLQIEMDSGSETGVYARVTLPRQTGPGATFVMRLLWSTFPGLVRASCSRCWIAAVCSEGESLPCARAS
jgi:hypothetical protein